MLLGVIMVVSTESPYKHAFQIVFIDKNSGEVSPILTTEYSDKYVDFVWSEFDERNEDLFILARDEDDPQMGQRVFHINIKQRKVVSVFITDIEQSFSSMRFVPNQGLFAISQGVPFKYGDNLITLKLLKIDTINMKTVVVFDLPTQHIQDWSGGVRHSQHGSVESNIFYQIFRSSEGRVFYGIDD